MPTSVSTRRRLRFGPYEADLHSRELRKEGTRLRLQAQPFQLLAMLASGWDIGVGVFEEGEILVGGSARPRAASASAPCEVCDLKGVGASHSQRRRRFRPTV